MLTYKIAYHLHTSSQQISQRQGIKRVILPRSCENDWKGLPDDVTDGLTATFVTKYDEIFDIVFPEEVQ